VKWYKKGITTDTYDKILDRIELPEHIGGSTGGAYYRGEWMGSAPKIKMGKSIKNHDGGASTYRHELGHHVDYTIKGNGRLFTESQEYKDAMDGDHFTYIGELRKVMKKTGIEENGDAGRWVSKVKLGFAERTGDLHKVMLADYQKSGLTIADYAKSYAKANFKDNSTAARLSDLFPFDYAANGFGGADGISAKLEFLAGLADANSIGSDLLHIENIWQKGFLFTQNQRAIWAATDVLEAVSMAKTHLTRMGGGHGTMYYLEGGGASTRKETFANIFSVFSPDTDRVVLDLIETIAPNQTKIIEGLLNGQ